jgi:hypothetical protein
MRKNQNYHLVEYAEYVSPDGVRLPMFGGNKALMSWEGMGVPEIDYISDTSPFTDGVIVRDFKYQSRNITFGLFEGGRQRKDFYKYNRRIVDKARPTRSADNNPGYIKVYLEDGSSKEIEARLSKGPMGNWGVREGQEPSDLSERLTFFCSDPFWRNADKNSVSFSAASQVYDCLSDTLCYPYCLRSTSVVLNQSIVYPGTWYGDQIDIVITGPLNNFSIENKTTGKKISLSYDILSGETVTISIDRDRETIVSSTNGNLIGTVENLSDFVDFRLYPSGEVTSDGTNEIEVTGVNNEEGVTEIDFSYYSRFITVFGE